MAGRWAALAVLALVTVGVWMLKQRASTPDATPPPVNAPVGVWDWTTFAGTEPSLAPPDELQARGVKELYLDLTSYAKVRTNKRSVKTYEQALQRLVAKYNAAGIAVFAAGGDPGWSLPRSHDVPLAILRYAQAYNDRAAADERLAGIYFDIEPHTHEEHDTRQRELLVGLAQLASKLQVTAQPIQERDPDFRLGLVMPSWYDNSGGTLPDVELNGRTQPIGLHLMDQLGKLPSGWLVIMAYRNQTGGNDGSIEQLRPEFEYAQQSAPNVKLQIGQEVTDIEPAKTTFYGLGRDQLQTAINELTSAYGQQPTFGGFVINDRPGYLEL